MTSVPTMIGMMLRETALLAGADLTAVTAVRMGTPPIVFTAHPDDRPTPDLSVGVAHPNVSLRLVDGTNGDAQRGHIADALPGIDERLSQSARGTPRRH